MSAFHYLLSYLMFQVSWSQISFTETAPNQIYYPRFAVDVGSNPCGHSICTTCIQIRCNNGVIKDSNQQYDNEYAWDYSGTTFEAPLTFVITKSNNDQIWLNNFVTNYDTWRTWSDGTKFCPATPAPTKTPTETPTKTPTKSPTNDPTLAPSFNPTKNPSNNPTNNPTTPSPTDPDELTCNDMITGTYNNIPLSFEVRLPYNGDIIFNASHSDFPFTSLTAYNAQATPITTTNTKTLIISDNIIGDYTFIISADNGITGTFHIQISCQSDQPTSSPIRSPTIIPTISPTKSPTKIPTFSPSKRPSKSPIFSPTFSPTNNNNGGEIEDESTTQIAGNNNANDRKKEDGLVSISDNDTFVVILGVIIGVLACCILILLVCFFMKRKKETEMMYGMELGHIMSDNVVAKNVEMEVIHIESNDTRAQQVSMQSIVNDINYNVYDETMALKMWLNAMNMNEYYNVFVKEGFAEQLCTVGTLNDDDLLRMGICKWEDRRVILNQIDIMKMTQVAQQNNGNYEGNAVNNEKQNEVAIRCDYNTAGYSP